MQIHLLAQVQLWENVSFPARCTIWLHSTTGMGFCATYQEICCKHKANILQIMQILRSCRHPLYFCPTWACAASQSGSRGKKWLQGTHAASGLNTLRPQWVHNIPACTELAPLCLSSLTSVYKQACTFYTDTFVLNTKTHATHWILTCIWFTAHLMKRHRWFYFF